jgi:hypothetical protein
MENLIIQNLEVKNIAKKLKKFITAYSTYSIDLKNYFKDYTYNNYLTMISKFVGFSDYNQLHQTGKENLLIDVNLIIDKLNIFINSAFSQLDDLSKKQFIRTFQLYLNTTVGELDRKRSSVRAKMRNRLDPKKKDDYGQAQVRKSIREEIKILTEDNFFILDSRSITYLNTSLIPDFEALTVEYIDCVNVSNIRRYFTKKVIPNLDDITALPAYLKSKGTTLYPLEFLKLLDKRSHTTRHFIEDRDLLYTGFNKYQQEIAFGGVVLYKGVLKKYRKPAGFIRVDETPQKEFELSPMYEITMTDENKLFLVFHSEKIEIMVEDINKRTISTLLSLSLDNETYYVKGKFHAGDYSRTETPYYYPKRKGEHFELYFSIDIPSFYIYQDKFCIKYNDNDIDYFMYKDLF